jgi:hypothetical protein
MNEMTISDDHEHEPLIDELRDMFAHDDPVPPLVTEAAKAAFGWRRLDADLAELLSDSALQDESLALARGAEATLRSVSFSAGPLAIDVQVHGEGADRTVLGQLSPPTQTRIELQTADEPAATATQSDKLGRFRIRLGAANSFRLRVSIEGRSGSDSVETSWIPL